MKIIETKQNLISYIQSIEPHDNLIGFVPTMGALHNGHLSLIEQSILKCKKTIVSIFINPSQFNDKNDFENYPQALEKDIEKLLPYKVDVLFLPTIDEMYPNNFCVKTFNLGRIENIFEGKERHHHYQGVCMVINEFLKMIHHHFLFLGQKDFQQCVVLQKLIALENFKTKIVICKTKREESGLAMSSRNERLNPNEKKEASLIFECISDLSKSLKSFEALKIIWTEKLLKHNIIINYLDYVDAAKLEKPNNFNNPNLVLLIAANIGKTRLIDNIFINQP